MRGDLTVYSTNSFDISRGSGHTLRRIVVPKDATSVVADISSLITLSRLKLLEPFAATFETVFVPESYKAMFVRERQHLLTAQQSRRRALLSIIGKLESQTISVCEDDSVPLVDDGDDGDVPSVLSSADLAGWLYRNGHLSKTDSVQCAKQCHGKVNPVHIVDSTLAAKRIAIDSVTLETIAHTSMLDVALKAFAISITPKCHSTIKGEHQLAEERRSVAEWQDEVRRCLDRVPNIVWSPWKIPQESESKKGELERDDFRLDAFAATLLAQEKCVPLLVDDRWAQANLVFCSNAEQTCAFGTDALLNFMYSRGSIGLQQLAGAWSRLLEWRYEFLVPPSEVLLYHAKEYANAPSDQLRAIVSYMHDSLSDVGLFFGIENSVPPVPMGLNLLIEWMKLTASFCTAVWNDVEVGEINAKKLVEWALDHMLPPLPRNMPWQQQHGLSQMVDQLLFQLIVFDVGQHGHLKRLRGLLDTMRAVLGISQQRYVQIIAEVLHV